MGQPEIALRAAAALWMIAGTLAASYRLGGAVVGGRGLALRFAAVALAGMGLATAGFHLLLPLGGFTLPVGLAACTLLGLGAYLAPPGPAELRAQLARDARALRRLRRALGRSPERFVALFFGIFAGLLILRTLVVPPLAWDTLTYHGVRAALWVQSGQYTLDPGPGPWTGLRHVFAGSEILSAWAMLPFHGDLLAGLASAVQWAGVGLAAYAYARELGLREPYASTAAGVGLFVPTLQLLVGTGYAEPALLLALLATAALALRFFRRPEGQADGKLACLALAGCGLMAGIKLPGVPPALVITGLVAVWGLLASRRPGGGRRLGWIALGGLLALVPVVPWMVHCYEETGYLVNLPVSVLGGKLGVSNPASAWFLDRPKLAPYRWKTETAALRTIFARPGTTSEALGFLTLLPLVGFPFGLFALTRRRPLAAVLVSGLMLTVLAFYWSRDVAVLRLLWSANLSRFLLGGVLLALPVSLLGFRRASRAGGVYRALLLLAAGYYAWFFSLYGWTVVERYDAAAALILLSMGFLVLRGLARSSPRLALGFAVAFWIAGSLHLAGRWEETRSAAARLSLQLHPEPKYWADAAEILDLPGEPQRIAITSGPLQDADNWFTYFFLGSHFENRLTYVPVTRDGTLVPFGPNYDLDRAARRQHWLRRLDESRVTAVMSFRPLSIEQQWMDSMPGRFEKLRGGRDWGLYRVR